MFDRSIDYLRSLKDRLMGESFDHKAAQLYELNDNTAWLKKTSSTTTTRLNLQRKRINVGLFQYSFLLRNFSMTVWKNGRILQIMSLTDLALMLVVDQFQQCVNGGG